MQLAFADINLSALRNNYTQLQSLAPKSQIIAIVKANAYGHGSVETAHALPEAPMFGVARIDEALELRASGITQPILLLEGFFNANEIPELAAANIQVVIHSDWQLDALERAKLPAPVAVWLKVDTGMKRLGISSDQFGAFNARLQNCANVIKPIQIMSHFACASEVDHPSNRHQLDQFTALPVTNEKRSMANSAAIVTLPDSHFDYVRPGILLYGISPLASAHSKLDNFKPVMSLKTSVIAVKPLKKGESVGYGSRWTSPKDSMMAVVGIGYGDGYPRQAIDGTPVLIKGQQYPLIGTVSMDMISVDIGLSGHVQVGDEVELWGQNIDVNIVAEHAHTIGYHLVSNVTPRVTTRYINGVA